MLANQRKPVCGVGGALSLRCPRRLRLNKAEKKTVIGKCQEGGAGLLHGRREGKRDRRAEGGVQGRKGGDRGQSSKEIQVDLFKRGKRI